MQKKDANRRRFSLLNFLILALIAPFIGCGLAYIFRGRLSGVVASVIAFITVIFSIFSLYEISFSKIMISYDVSLFKWLKYRVNFWTSLWPVNLNHAHSYNCCRLFCNFLLSWIHVSFECWSCFLSTLWKLLFSYASFYWCYDRNCYS